MELMAIDKSRAEKGKVICKPLSPAGVEVTAATEREGDLSTVATFAAINSRRARAGLSIEDVIAEARIHPKTWLQAQHTKGSSTRAGTLRKIDTAIDRLIRTGAASTPPVAIAALVRAIEVVLLSAIGWDRDLMGALDPMRRRNDAPRALPAGRLRLIAIYIAAVDLEIANADIARALGIERQAVKQARDKVHELRDDPRADALLDRCAQTLRGET